MTTHVRSSMYIYLVLLQTRVLYCQLLSNYTHLSLGGHFILKFTVMFYNFLLSTDVNVKRKAKIKNQYNQVSSQHMYFVHFTTTKSTQRSFISKTCNHQFDSFILRIHIDENKIWVPSCFQHCLSHL